MTMQPNAYDTESVARMLYIQHIVTSAYNDLYFSKDDDPKLKIKALKFLTEFKTYKNIVPEKLQEGSSVFSELEKKAQEILEREKATN